MGRTKILVIDAEDSVPRAVRDALADADADVIAENRFEAAMASILAERPGVVVASLRALGDNPSSWIARAVRTHPALVAVLVANSQHDGMPPIPEAFDILEHSPSVAALRRSCGRAIEHHLLLDRLHSLGGNNRDGAPRGDDGAGADRRFRDAKRTVVDAFEQAYLQDLLKRHRGNVTAAASHSGMLRSALQRLLRKHDLRSSEFRRDGSPDSKRERSV